MKVLYCSSPLEKWNINEDSTPLMISEVLKRGGQTYFTTPDNLFIDGIIPMVRYREIDFNSDKTDFVLGDEFRDKLNIFDVIHLRTDPPFDMNYFYSTVILEMVVSDTLVINSPPAVRNFNEKLTILKFPEFITDTLVSQNVEEIIQFSEKFKNRIILKDLGECSSRGIVKIDEKTENIRGLIEECIEKWKSAIMIQRFLSQIHNGETRITLINGEIAGWARKIPRKDNFLASLDFGAEVESCVLSSRDKLLSEKVGMFLRNNGIILAALDVIDGHLSEINITSPGLLKHTNDVMGIRLEEKLEDSVSLLVKNHKKL